ncbi:hypothetical protein OU5_5575 [Pseudomonas mandelii JR-1]|uniref:Uncharacterized protein n=2 Tax=Pseudomonas mandelii TaxID=75612 RepID=A0A024EI64_9PSED|nr:hypothetical protein OU5_5575 [Pseudomonas mandelii JR-1]
MGDALTALNLPEAIRVQATKLLGAITQARDLSELLRAAGRAEGFVLGLETVYPLTIVDVENLYVVVEAAVQRRHAELGG